MQTSKQSDLSIQMMLVLDIHVTSKDGTYLSCWYRLYLDINPFPNSTPFIIHGQHAISKVIFNVLYVF